MEVNTPAVGLISFLGVNQLSLPVMTLAFGIDDIKSGDSKTVISGSVMLFSSSIRRITVSMPRLPAASI